MEDICKETLKLTNATAHVLDNTLGPTADLSNRPVAVTSDQTEVYVKTVELLDKMAMFVPVHAQLMSMDHQNSLGLTVSLQILVLARTMELKTSLA